MKIAWVIYVLVGVAVNRVIVAGERQLDAAVLDLNAGHALAGGGGGAQKPRHIPLLECARRTAH